MKNRKVKNRKRGSFCLALVTLLFALAACKDHDVTSKSPDAIATLLQAGDWQVTLFFDGKNQKPDFDGFVFSFNKEGVVRASGAQATHTGTWRAEPGYKRAVKVSLEFPAVEPFVELNSEWGVVENSESKIRFENAGGNNEGLQNANKLVIERI